MGIGTVIFKPRIENVIKVIKRKNTLWNPCLKTSLIATSKATDNRCTVQMYNLQKYFEMAKLLWKDKKSMVFM